MKASSKSLARCALGTAVGVLVLFLASLLPTARLALLCAASLGVVFVQMTEGRRPALGCYTATALLSLLLLPQKGAAVIYALLTGYYPLAKLRLEQTENRLLRWGGKILLFNLVFLVLYLGFSALLYPGGLLPEISVWLLWVAANVVFLVYDFALTQVILIYLRKISGRVK